MKKPKVAVVADGASSLINAVGEDGLLTRNKKGRYN